MNCKIEFNGDNYGQKFEVITSNEQINFEVYHGNAPDWRVLREKYNSLYKKLKTYRFISRDIYTKIELTEEEISLMKDWQ